MKSEPLNIHDKTFLVNRLIQQAPTGTVIREFFKNCDENAALAPDGNRRIDIYPVEIGGVRKLAFWNTGPGMNAEELRRATDLSSSINKSMAINGNFGIGAKVSGLTMSPEGIRYRSCKDGTVHEVTIGYDADLGTYARFAAQLSDGSEETVYDVTKVAKDEGKDTTYDWTEVVLYGEDPTHDTVSFPLGRKHPAERSLIPTTIFRRFAEFSPGVEVRVDTAMTKGGGKEDVGRFRRLRTLDQVLPKLGRHETVIDKDTGVSIRFIHDPRSDASSHALSARANPATASTTFCALVHKGERYDFKTKNSWSAAAPNFGVPFGSKVLTVEIFLSDEMALPNQYRDGLTWPENRASMTTNDFSDFVRELMPEWVKDVVRSHSPAVSEDLKDLESDLQRLLDEFRVPTVAISARKSGATTFSPSGSGEDVAEPISFSEGDSLEEDSGELLERPEGSSRRTQRKVRRAPEGAQASEISKALERVPEIKILIDPEEIQDKLLKGRAGRYYKDAHILFVNGLYPVVERMVSELEPELTGTADAEILRSTLLTAARRSMAYRVGKAACFAISKKDADDWSTADLDMATSPESLSMAADDYRQSLAGAKRWTKERIRSSQLEAAA